MNADSQLTVDAGAVLYVPSAAQQIMSFYREQAWPRLCVRACVRAYACTFSHELTCRFYVLFIFDVVLCAFRIPAQYTLSTFLKCQLINLSTLFSLSPLPLLHGDAVRHHFLFVSFCLRY